MENMSSETLVTVVTIIVAGIGILLGSLVPAIVEGKAAVKALEGIVRQPEAAADLRPVERPGRLWIPEQDVLRWGVERTDGADREDSRGVRRTLAMRGTEPPHPLCTLLRRHREHPPRASPEDVGEVHLLGVGGDDVEVPRHAGADEIRVLVAARVELNLLADESCPEEIDGDEFIGEDSISFRVFDRYHYMVRSHRAVGFSRLVQAGFSDRTDRKFECSLACVGVFFTGRKSKNSKQDQSQLH